MDNCAGVRATVPLLACGQMNLPRSSLFEKRQRPSPDHHKSLIRSPRRPRNTNTCPENGFSSSAVCTMPLSPTKPRRRSVTPATIQILVPAGSPIIPATPPTPPAGPPDPPSPSVAAVLSEARPESCWKGYGVPRRHWDALPPRPPFGGVYPEPSERAQGQRREPPATRPLRDGQLPTTLVDIAAARRTPGWRSHRAPAPRAPPKRPAPRSLARS